MSPQDPSRAVHDEIREVLGDRSLRGEALCRTLFAIGSRHLIEPFRAALRELSDIDLPEIRARGAFQRIEAHRAGLEEALGCDPGFEVAALDYLHEVEDILREPVFHDRLSGAAGPPGRPDRIPPRGPESEELEIRRAERTGRPLAVVTLGPDPGRPAASADAAVSALRDAARDTDIARGDSEGMTLLLPCTDGAGALRAAERYRRVLADSTGVPWSAGVADSAGDPARTGDLEIRARRALLAARTGGGDRSEAERPERRAHPRRRAGGAVTGRIVTGDARTDVVVEDLSLGGALVATRAALQPGADVVLALRGTAARSREVTVPSRVERALGRPGAPLPWHAALVFPRDVEARLRVADLMADLPEPSAVRPQPGTGRPTD